MNIKESTIEPCVDAKAQDGKMRRIMITTATMGIIFNLQNSHLLSLCHLFVLAAEEVFRANGQNRPVTNPPVVDFRSHERETPSAWLSGAKRRVVDQQLIDDISTQFASVLLTLAGNKIGSKRADRWKSWLTAYCDDFPHQFCADCGLKMSSAMPKDPNHTITQNGIHCSNSDCVLPMCINSKLGNLIKKSTDCKRAEKSKATSDTSLKNAADYKVNSAAANGDM